MAVLQTQTPATHNLCAAVESKAIVLLRLRQRPVKQPTNSICFKTSANCERFGKNSKSKPGQPD